MPVRTIAEPFAQKMGARIRDIRIEQGKSLAAVEAVCGVSRGHLSSIERGRVLVNIITLRNIARALEMRLAELVEGIE